MRPLPGGDGIPSNVRPRSPKSSGDAAANASHVPTSFFMRSEGDMEQSLSNTRTAGRPRDSTFGVQSLADTLEAAFGPESATARKEADQASSTAHIDTAASPGSSTGLSTTSPLRKPTRKLSSHASSTPRVVDAPSPAPTSAMSSTPSAVSLHSLKLSDDGCAAEEAASQAMTSSGDEDGAEADTQQGAAGSFPQLVMPSIQMPARRPFTVKGKNMGKLKILVAGEMGIGKTALIRSVVQLCEDIVHVDPLSPSNSFSHPPQAKPKARKRRADHTATTQVSEIHASTKPYPHWWTDVEDSRVLRRRKNSLDAVLERNICFVDTPGFVRGPAEKEDMNLVVDYVESLLHQTLSMTSMEDSDALGLVSGSGGASIDLVIYLLPPNIDLSSDFDFMQRLSSLTNVMPVVAKSDTLSAADAIALKVSILARLQTTPIRPFFFGKAVDDALLAVQGLSIVHPQPPSTEADQCPFNTPTYPYAISSTSRSDHEIMDASLLMSPGYIQPLLPSELATFVNQIFDPDAIAWLRHSAAKKFLAWRRVTRLRRDSAIIQSLQQPRSPTSASVGLNGTAMNTSANSSVFSVASLSGVLVPRSGSPFYSSNLQSPFLGSSASLAQSDSDRPADFSVARYNSPGQGEPPLSELRIAKWATDLQQSLRNERDRFEELQRNDRAKWLLERVGEEVSRGAIVASPGGSPRAEWAVVRHGDDEKQAGQRYSKTGKPDSRDPLGLCNLSDEVRKKGFVLAKVLGGFSVIGAVVITVVRACGAEAVLPQIRWWKWLTGDAE